MSTQENKNMVPMDMYEEEELFEEDYDKSSNVNRGLIYIVLILAILIVVTINIGIIVINTGMK
ncbi:MAG: hypothetical protein IJZ81_05100 [Clostridia bacterium]|nr:hypothetical protein [Clostridia bacterium]